MMKGIEQRVKRHLRPAQGAQKLGVSLSSFWRLSKSDPDFPQMVKLSPRCTLIDDDAIDRYIAAKALAQVKVPA